MGSDQIADGLRRYLDRQTPPQGLKDKPEALKAEAADLLRMLRNSAPSEGIEGWLADVLNKVNTLKTTRAWPTANELQRAIREASRHSVGIAGDGWFPNPYKINAGRMFDGLTVPEDYVWGRAWWTMLALGWVTGPERERYVEGFRKHLEDVYRNDTATITRMLEDRHRRHMASKGDGEADARRLMAKDKRWGVPA